MDVKFSVIFMEKHWLRVFEKSLVRKVLWPMREDVTGQGRKLHNDELHCMYYSENISLFG
jgi:hypothetical protein